MRILILGAGATGGYFGGRMLEAGLDVAFLVREGRARQLRADGLRIVSPQGEWRGVAPVYTSVADLPPFDLIVLSCKAYDLDAAVAAIRPAMGAETVVLPLLNGIAHLDRLDQEFGQNRVLGGFCYVAVTVSEDGWIQHMNHGATLSFGARVVEQEPVVKRLADLLRPAKFAINASTRILDQMWEKTVFITVAAALTCLFRASIGEINMIDYSQGLVVDLFNACAAVARRAGADLSGSWREKTLAALTDKTSSLTASMLRDVLRNGQTEYDHLFGFMLRLGDGGPQPPLLTAAYIALRLHEQKRSLVAGDGFV